MKKLFICILSLVLLFGMTGCEIDKGAGGNQTKSNEPSTEKADLTDLYNLSDAQYLTVIDGVVNEERSIKSDGFVYIPYSIVKSLDSRFYFNSAEEQMLITTSKDVLCYWPDTLSHEEQGERVEDKAAMLRTFEGHLFVSTDIFLRYSDVNTRVMENPSRVVLFRNGVDYDAVTVNKDTCVRYGASMQKPIVTELKAGTMVLVAGKATNGFLPVSTEDGLVGFVSQADIGESSKRLLHTSMKDYERIVGPDHIHMMWHQMWAVQGGEDLRSALLNTKGVNVIAPTWFDFKDVDGSIVSFANASYVEEAHRRGIQVWALCSDFAEDVKGYDVLSNTESRRNLEQNLVSEVVRVGADGINLDFEYITKDSGPHYLQFIRELYLLCRENNLILSVCDFVPSAGKSQYKLAEQADVADYIVFMAYDEHYKASGAGSVASYPWVEMAVSTAVQIIPPEKIVLGIPVFNRIWATDKDGKLSIENGGMTQLAEKMMKGANGEAVWNEDSKQYYVEYTNTKEGVRYQCWIEDATSLEYKLKLIPEYNLCGYAGWKLGLEATDVWSLLEKY